MQLDGKFVTGDLRSIVDITAEIEKSIISFFNTDLGYKTIRITSDSNEIIYEETVNTSIHTQYEIPLYGFPSGIYTIDFSNELGAMYGKFSI